MTRVAELIEQTLDDFAPGGILSCGRGFEFRAEQQELAAAVARALENERALLAEAGTGVGKSLAYLMPSIRFALTRGRKAIVSTHTINLQEQLFSKDIPTAAKALGLSFRTALLKGRSHYLCRTRLQRAIEQAKDLFNQEELRQLKVVREWAEDCGEGWLSSIPADLGVSEKVKAQVCSENYTCTLRNCGPTCPYQAARRQVEEADLVVLNHTLFFGLMSLAEEARNQAVETGEDEEEHRGFIFANDFVVLDEAHTIENVAAHQFGSVLPEAELRRDLWRLYNPRTRKGTLRHAATPRLLQLIEEAQMACDEFFERAALDARFCDDENRQEVRLRRPNWTEDVLTPALRELEGEVLAMSKEEENELTRAEFMDTAARLIAYRMAAEDVIALHDEGNAVYWAEKGGEKNEKRRFLTLRSALVNVAPVLREKLFESGRACICTSATLSAGDAGTAYFAGRVGAECADAIRIGSPFDFARQMRVTVARSMPLPNEDAYSEELPGRVLKALEATDGCAFVLFTSYRTLRSVAEKLRVACAEHGWRLLVQGDGISRSDMLDMFRRTKGSVLLGTDSFWMGVDVPGEALSHVIVTKLPFDSPGTPLVEARSEDILARGGSPFMEYAMPEAILKFRQGVGRLIRSKTDSGAVTILDSRLCHKYYGKQFLRALPPGAPCAFE